MSWSYNTRAERLFVAFAICVILSTIISVYFQHYYAFLLPALIIGGGLIIDDYRRLFYLLFALLPFTVEFYFEGAGIGLDLPAEPIMLLLTGFVFFTWIRHKFALDRYYATHPIVILLTAHLLWILTTTLNSTYVFISFKLFMAKIWYIIPFFILPLIWMQRTDELSKAYKILYKFLFVAICIVLVRHAFEGFSFAASYDVVRPFFRNHVNYAAICVICLPFVWAFLRIHRHQGLPSGWLRFIFLIFIVGIYFSYTRAAILSMGIALGAFYIIRQRWVTISLTISTVVAIIGIVLLSYNNKYMDFAPDFEKTITHTEFDNLLEATYKLEDISSMERVYRWMAGIEMVKDRFWMGFGPGTFYSNYKMYSISRFQTYVSNNPDQSGIHNYYLMTWVEQGLIGFVLFMLLCFSLLIEGERVYHRCTEAQDRYLVMAATLGFIIIFAMCLINDLIETDKVGPFFFFNMAILLFYGRKYAVNR
jgi:O-antigen ligase